MAAVLYGEHVEPEPGHPPAAQLVLGGEQDRAAVAVAAVAGVDGDVVDPRRLRPVRGVGQPEPDPAHLPVAGPCCAQQHARGLHTLGHHLADLPLGRLTGLVDTITTDRPTAGT
jgi:hypothetical protein